MASIFNLEHQHGDALSKLVASLERLTQAFRVLLWEAAKAHGLSPVQVQILIHLRYHGEAERRVNRLAERFDLTPATVSDAVTTLKSKGLLDKDPCPADRRATRLVLTSKGKTLVSELEGWAEPLRTHLTAFSRGEQTELLTLLMRLIASLQREGVISVARMCLSCRFYSAEYPSGAPHYCQLLDIPLSDAELRIDCPEHEAE